VERPENPSGNNYVLGLFRGLSRRGDGSERNSRARLLVKRLAPAFERRERKNHGEDQRNKNQKTVSKRRRYWVKGEPDVATRSCRKSNIKCQPDCGVCVNST
jgi:hypothetical protein